MWDFLPVPSDYVVFLHGVALIVLASICVGLLRLRADRLAWFWLFLFALVRGVSVWLGLLPLSVLVLPWMCFGSVLLDVVCLLALFEFTRSSLAAWNRRINPLLFHAPLTLFLAGSLSLADGALNGTMQGLLHVLALTIAAWLLARECPQVPRPARCWLGGAAAALLVLALLRGIQTLALPQPSSLIASHDEFLPFPQLVGHAATIFVLAGLGWCLLIYSVAMLARPQVSLRPVHLHPWRPITFVSLTLLTVLVGGYFATQVRARSVDEVFRHVSMQRLQNEVRDLSRRLNEVQRLAVVMSGSPNIIRALEQTTPGNLTQANQVLDRYRQGAEVSVCYVLDRQGKCLTSSNRNTPQSFVGMDYRFRPYAERALHGEINTYYALGTQSGIRGMYAAAPVRAANGEILGATVVKHDLTDLIADPNHERCLFFVDPHGIVFLATDASLTLRSLWPLPPEMEAQIIKSRQFGNGPFPPVLPHRVYPGDMVFFHNASRLVFREPVGTEGWSLVMLASRQAVADARRAVIGLVLFLTLLILGFSIALREAQVARAEVEASQRQYETLIEGSPNLVCLLDAQGRVAQINQAGLKALHRERTEALGQSFADFWQPDSAKTVQAHVIAALTGLAQNCDGQLAGNVAAPTIWSISLTPISHPQRGVCGLVVICNNVTERHLAHRAAHNHAELLSNVLNHIPSYVFWKDRNLVYQGCNSQFAKVAGLAHPRQIVGKTDLNLPWKLRQPESDREWEQQVMASGQSMLNLEETFQLDKEQQLCVLSSKVPLRDETGQIVGVLGVYSDITDRKRRELAERERLSLREAVTAMQNVLGVVSHELRTPLAGLRAMTEYLITDQQHTEETRQLLTSIHDEVLRMAEMVNNLLEAARLNSGASRWKWSEFTLDTVCQEALTVLRPLIDSTQVALNCQITPPNLTMRGDADAVRRLILNLITNAHRHTRRGRISIQIHAVTIQDASYIALYVRDSGIGIPPHILERLGTPFALNSGVIGPGHTTGAGLGLAICKAIVVAHGGNLTIASKPNQGTEVRVLLRRDLAAPCDDNPQTITVTTTSDLGPYQEAAS